MNLLTNSNITANILFVLIKLSAKKWVRQAHPKGGEK